ncbi:maleylpyruvate isomerase N-terminal domain-containing protein [Phaeacidiphilus oryzae]|uniref:maleylpyruvate isomerase N-terminal domain-containing protein n=1 Tax=Phaeacidiphilus oryzae TaxID=348818 RepID=UPI00055C4052|nr:maleylpyruvate isomerase N-terminal domain-containing protein [Phaeacidiphilus oryzae]
MDWLPHERYLDELGRQAEAFASTVAGADGGARVPSCPEWTLTELVGHAGGAVWWGGEIVRRRADPDLEPMRLEEPEPPKELPAAAEWLVAQAGRLSRESAEAGPDAPCWSWGDAQRTGFWARRMTHELLIHRLDAALAVGGAGPDGDGFEVAAELAADNIDEYLGALRPIARWGFSKRLAELPGEDRTVRLVATDAAGGAAEAGEARAWALRRLPDGFTAGPAPADGPADAILRAPVRSLMLLVNRRLLDGWRAAPGLRLSGDAELVQYWLDRLAFE